MTGILDSTAAEVAVLGAALLSDRAADVVASRLDAGSWTRTAHQAVHAAVVALRKGGRAVDTMTVTEVLARQGRIDEVGGPVALHDLAVACPSPSNVTHYVDVVLDHQRRRDLARLATAAGQGALDPSRPLHATLAEVRSQLDGVRPAGRRLTVFTDDELDQLPAVEWLIDGVVQHRGLNIVYGPWKQGKSFVVLDMCLSLLSGGGDWHGRAARPVRSVVYVAAEGAHGMASRRQAWRTHRRRSPSGFTLVGSPLSLLDPSDVGELDTIVAESQAELLVIDTWARCIGGDENKNSDAGEAVRSLDRLRDRHGCAVVVVHHAGHGAVERTRGASALPAAADTQVRVSKQGDRLSVSTEFAKDAAAEARLAFRLVQAGPSAVPVADRGRTVETDEDVMDRLRTVLLGRAETVTQLDKIADGRHDLVAKVLEDAVCVDPMVQPARWRLVEV